MARNLIRIGAALALAATISTAVATPAMARDRGHGRHHDRDGIDGGDVLLGALILGGIAAIAASSDDDDNQPEYRDVEYREPYDDRPEYRPEYAPRAPSSGSYAGGGIDNAVDMCVAQVERGSETVASVDNAARTGDGWRISGQLGAGGGFSCWIDNDGRIRSVDLGGSTYYEGSSYDEPTGEQWDDETYARAREAQSEPEFDEEFAGAY